MLQGDSTSSCLTLTFKSSTIMAREVVVSTLKIKMQEQLIHASFKYLICNTHVQTSIQQNGGHQCRDEKQAACQRLSTLHASIARLRSQLAATKQHDEHWH